MNGQLRLSQRPAFPSPMLGIVCLGVFVDEAYALLWIEGAPALMECNVWPELVAGDLMCGIAA